MNKETTCCCFLIRWHSYLWYNRMKHSSQHSLNPRILLAWWSCFVYMCFVVFVKWTRRPHAFFFDLLTFICVIQSNDVIDDWDFGRVSLNVKVNCEQKWHGRSARLNGFEEFRYTLNYYTLQLQLFFFSTIDTSLSVVSYRSIWETILLTLVIDNPSQSRTISIMRLLLYI